MDERLRFVARLLEVVGPIFDEVNEKYGTKVEPVWK